MKTYIIGLDSVPVWLFKELSSEKEFDAINWFVKNGEIQDLVSNMPPVTASAWLSIYTGSSEGKIGVYDFFKLNGRYELELAEFNPDSTKPFWETGNLRSLIITPAMITKLTSNPKVDMVTGFPARYKTNNKAMSKYMKMHGLEEEPEVERKVEHNEISPLKASEILAQKIRLKYKLMEKMDNENNYDVVFICVTETDRMQHFTLSRKEWKRYQLPLFREINEIFRYVRSKSESDRARIIVVSDHGGVATYKKFIINSWLISKGYAKLKQNATKLKIDNEFIRAIYRKMPESIKKRAANLSSMAQGFTISDLDLENTIAFSTTSTNKIVPLWINDSRFALGKTSNSKHKRRIIADLKRLPFIKEVVDGRRYYGKTALFIVPDLLVEVKDGYTIKTNEISSNIIEDVDVFRGGEHTKYGMLGAYPKMLKKKRYSVKDIADLVLDGNQA